MHWTRGIRKLNEAGLLGRFEPRRPGHSIYPSCPVQRAATLATPTVATIRAMVQM
jgi:hypothetical protein